MAEPIYKILADNDAKSYWSKYPSTNKALDDFVKSDAAKILPTEVYETAKSHLSSKDQIDAPSVDLIEQMAKFIDEQNRRARQTYHARRVALIAVLQGQQAEAQVKLIRDKSGLSAEKLRDALMGTKIVNDKEVPTGKPADGITEKTMTYLEELIQQGKDEAKKRRDKAASNAGVKGGADS